MNQDIILLVISLIGFGLIAYLLYYLSGKVKDPPNLENHRQSHHSNNNNNNNNQENNTIQERGGLRHRRNEENSDGEDDDISDHTTRRDILKHEKRRAKLAMRQAEEARRDSKREKEEKRMEQLRERELEKEREFQIKEQIRLEEEAKRLREYNTWKDPYLISQYSLNQDEKLSIFINYILTHKIVSIRTLSHEVNIPVQICLQLLNELLSSNKLSGVIDGNGVFYLISETDITNLQKMLPLDKKINSNIVLNNIQQVFL